MADVRLTAVNPEDSQVYPVACNDKGELLLDSGGATGDLDVTGNLTVAGSTILAGVATVGDPSGDRIALNPNGTSHVSGNWFVGGDDSASSNIELSAQGSATFAGRVLSNSLATGSVVHDAVAGVNTSSFRRSHSGLNLDCIVQLPLVSDSNSPTGQSFIKATTNGVDKFSVGTDGSASFAGGKLYVDAGGGVYLGNPPLNEAPYTNRKISLRNDGSASFDGDVSAPNINFKLAPATVAAMPAPLIDEGFAANNEFDLLSVLMEMKLQIKDLNAFMQRSTQDVPET